MQISAFPRILLGAGMSIAKGWKQGQNSMGHAVSAPGHGGLRTPHRRWAFEQWSCGMENMAISTPLTTAAWGHAMQVGAALSYKAAGFSFTA